MNKEEYDKRRLIEAMIKFQKYDFLVIYFNAFSSLLFYFSRIVSVTRIIRSFDAMHTYQRKLY